jgi:2-methylcitrate dehydratase PrpD
LSIGRRREIRAVRRAGAFDPKAAILSTQTAVEAAMTLHPAVKDRLGDVERLVIETQEPGVRIIDKTGPLANPADRDVFFKDGSQTARVEVNYPIGHRRRRAEGMSVLVKKFEASVDAHFEPRQAAKITSLFTDPTRLDTCR